MINKFALTVMGLSCFLINISLGQQTISSVMIYDLEKVKPFINGRSWPFQCYLDLNGDLKRAFNVLYPPSTVIIGPGLKLFWNKIGYAPGDENEIVNKLEEILNHN